MLSFLKKAMVKVPVQIMYVWTHKHYNGALALYDQFWKDLCFQHLSQKTKKQRKSSLIIMTHLKMFLQEQPRVMDYLAGQICTSRTG